MGEKTITISPTADTYGTSANASTNYGSSTTADIWYGPQFEENVGSTTFIKFADADIPKGKIVSAYLYLSVTAINVGSGAGNCYIRNLSASWAEDTLTWNNRPSVYSTVYGRIDLGSTGANKKSDDLKDLITAWQSTNYGLRVNAGSIDASTIRTRENSTSTERPKLEITYIPVPSGGFSGFSPWIF